MLEPVEVKGITALRDHVIVADMNFAQRLTSSGILLPTDDKTTSGIRPRWAKVYAIGPDQQDVVVGEYVLVAHGRWTRGSEIEVDGEKITIRRVDPKDIMLVSNEPQSDDSVSQAVLAPQKTR